MKARALLLAVAAAVLLAACAEQVPAPRHGTTAEALAEADLLAADAWEASGRPGGLPERDITLIDCRDDLGASIELEYFRVDEDPAAREAVESVRRHWGSTPVREQFDGGSFITYGTADGFTTRAEWTSGEQGLRLGLATTECYPDAPEVVSGLG